MTAQSMQRTKIMNTDTFGRLLHESIDWRFKGFPTTSPPIPLGSVDAQAWNVFTDLLLPVLVLHTKALDHNLHALASYCTRHGVSLAPHGKTTMAPQLLARQLEAGAWAITAASLSHMRVYRAFGIDRILLANQLVDAPGLRWLGQELANHAEFDCYCCVDSLVGVQMMDTVLSSIPSLGRRLKVLVEIGASNTRAGCRSLKEIQAIAAAVRATSTLALVGISGYEGVIGEYGKTGEALSATCTAIDGYLQDVCAWTEVLARQGAFVHAKEVILSCGGSAFFDRVVHHFTSLWKLGVPFRVVLRSGCYLTHDHGYYAACSPLDGRTIGEERLQPALELWGTVLSRPQANRAILGFGKRDVSFDLGYPLPLKIRAISGQMRVVADEMQITGLNDQHAYLQVSEDDPLAVGDMVGCGISHPCTTIDKWPLIPLINSNYHVTGAVRTFF